MGDDMDIVQAGLDERVAWGENQTDRTVQALLAAAKRLRDRVEQGEATITALSDRADKLAARLGRLETSATALADRVAALETKPPA